MSNSSPEKGAGLTQSVERGSVVQPMKVDNRMDALSNFLEGINMEVSEKEGDKPGEQWSGSQGGTAVATSQAQTGTSARSQAIANLPAPAVMQKQLEQHIRSEVKKLRKQAMSIARMSRPGAAFHLNQLYARIRSLNALLADLFDASVDVLKRMFIKVFIDKQAIE
jgi:hypothetical protein